MDRKKQQNYYLFMKPIDEELENPKRRPRIMLYEIRKNWILGKLQVYIPTIFGLKLLFSQKRKLQKHLIARKKENNYTCIYWFLS